MKLVDILARELKEWPEAFGDVLGQRCDGDLHGYNDAGFVTWIGQTPKLTRCDNYMHDIVTRVQWQEARDALNKPAAKEWNGEGLPPAGTVCELRNVPAGTPWSEATIMFASRNVIVWEWVDDPQINGLCTAYAHAVEMRPIRTPEQIAAEERRSAIECLAGELGGHWSEDAKAPHRDMAACLYDSGWRKQESKPE